MVDAHPHDWKFQFCEYGSKKHWYRCSICGEEDWLAGDKTVAQMMPKQCKPNDKERGFMETTLQPKITGYRQLSKEEAALMNEGKALAEKCGEYIAKLRGYVPNDVNEKLEAGEIGEYKAGSSLDQRWISIGATDLQRGFMAVIRGIAQPTTF